MFYVTSSTLCRCSRRVMLCLLLTAMGHALRGDIIVSVSGPLNGGSFPISDLPSQIQVLASSWTTPRTYTDVTITALLTGGTGHEGIAYLMTQIGPGTTAADQLAQNTFLFPSDVTTVSLFSGLTLPPGTYYLVLGSDGPDQAGAWRDATGVNSPPEPTISLDAGVTRNEDFIVDTVSAYAPASEFVVGRDIFGDDVFLQYSVVAVPEPATFGMVGIILLLMAFNFSWRPGHRSLSKVSSKRST